MQKINLSDSTENHLVIISLKRTPKRLQECFKRNSHTLGDWNVHILEGIDGTEHNEIFEKARLISKDVLERWSAGAIGSALSHMLSWRLCLRLNKPMIVVEDDVVLASNLSNKIKTLLQHEVNQASFLLLGWNLDSLLQAEFEPGLGLISLFEPAYPNEKQLTKLVNSPAERRICKLKRCFGLPAYRITPTAAEYLLKELNPITSNPISMGRGIPTHYSETLDGALNNKYEKINAGIVFPPLALALNNQSESLTRKRKQQDFHE